MALNAYLKLKGQKQGEIKGSVTQKGREGKIMVIAGTKFCAWSNAEIPSAELLYRLCS